MSIGVVIVAYDAGEILLDCLEALRAAARAPGAPPLRVLVVDNDSPDGTLARLRGWAAGEVAWPDPARGPLPFAPVPRPHRDLHGGDVPGGGGSLGDGSPGVRIDARDLAADGRHPALPPLGGEGDSSPASSPDTVGFLQTGTNGGFAAGVNRGIETFEAMPEVDWFWVLNPDAMTEEGTPAALAAAARQAEAADGFAAMGGRIYYTDPPLRIQADAGGRADLWTGRMLPFAMGRTGRDVPPPAPGSLDYVSGAHLMASRAFLERAGSMPEDWFLYFEEVDWCLRRGDLPLIHVAGAAVHHHSGASIGSAAPTRGPSPLSAYWMSRNRPRFVRRWNPKGVPTAVAYTAFKIAQMRRQGHRAAAAAGWRGLTGRPYRPGG